MQTGSKPVVRDISISVYFARAVLKNAVEKGLDPISLLRKNRISPRLLMEDREPWAGKLFSSIEYSTAPAEKRSNLTPSTSWTRFPARARRTSSGSRKYSVPCVVSVIADRSGANRDYYGRDVSPRDILSGKVQAPTGALALRRLLAEQ